jgi:fructose-1,6-bisphosphatase/inositol monophosphatase family enzyme
MEENRKSNLKKSIKLREKYNYVKQLVIENGEYLKYNFFKDFMIDEKERGHLTTKLDLEIEKVYKNKLEKKFCDIGFYGEEKYKDETSENSKKSRWIVDSIDGTANYIFGIPYFATSIAIEVNNKIELGIVYNPITEELYEAYIDEENGYLNNEKISISKIDKIKNQKFIFGYSGNYKNITKYYNEWKYTFDNCKKSIGMLAPSLNICNVAKGKIEGFIDFGVSMEGQSAASLILKKAGGFLYNYDKSVYDYKKVGIVAINNKPKN